MLEQLGLLVDEVPGDVEHLDEEELEQAVVAQRPQRDAPALLGEARAPVALVLEEAELGQPAEHAGDRAGGDAEALGERVGGDGPVEPGLQRVDGLQVVLDGARCRRWWLHSRQPRGQGV